jgi:DNA-binding NarL/FixJ family response regulator
VATSRKTKTQVDRRFRWTEHEVGIAILSFDVAAPAGKKTAISQKLTPAQRKVARLAVRGLTNAEIASELKISVRTAANHMAAILERTGSRSRFDLAREFSE